eukprot:gb/GECG01014042.1/.p1 GENE.gb/GECG01014042.1/~~gb/GECG01014042.1/.p1  ORF type:complete len:114 (+),score=15.94 gb/GECG01014042.1/:1-342(+)
MDEHRYEEGARRYKEAIDVDAMLSLARYEETITACDRAIEENPDVKGVYYIKGRALFHLKKYQQAIERLETAKQMRFEGITEARGTTDPTNIACILQRLHTSMSIKEQHKQSM